MPRALASRVIRSATSRTWPTEPGRAGQLGRVQRLHRVDHADLGPLGLERREHRVEVGLGQRPAPRSAAPGSRSARSLICAADSSPET